jgi:hypothetical protein
MALTDKEKESIVEEETLRYSTRKSLSEAGGCCKGGSGHGHGCGKGRCGSWLGWGVAVVLGLIMLFHCNPCRKACPTGMGGPGCRMMGGHGWQNQQGMQPNCRGFKGGMMQEQGDEGAADKAPAAPAKPEAKAKK